MAEYKLISEIIKLSNEKTWDAAKLEWQLIEIYESEDENTCLCGHYPIKELCTIQNKITKKEAVVGNCCVNKFIGIPSEKIFQSLKRIRKDIDRSLNAESIQYAFDHNVINDWERNFYFDIMRKRILTDKQLTKKIDINKKFLNNIRRLSKTGNA